jgi:hypothetical protein
VSRQIGLHIYFKTQAEVCFFDPPDPRSGMRKKSRSGMNNPRAWKQIFELKILIFSEADPDPGSS